MKKLARRIYKMYNRSMGFEWDERKNQSNAQKHGVNFQDAVRIFDGPVMENQVNRPGEPRLLAVGLMKNIEITVVYTLRGKKKRIISARRAKKNERKKYRETLKKIPD